MKQTNRQRTSRKTEETPSNNKGNDNDKQQHNTEILGLKAGYGQHTSPNLKWYDRTSRSNF
jgi:hypothetical protein